MGVPLTGSSVDGKRVGLVLGFPRDGGNRGSRRWSRESGPLGQGKEGGEEVEEEEGEG